MSILQDNINITKGDTYTTMSMVFSGRFSNEMIKKMMPHWDLEEIILNAVKSCPLDKWPEHALNRIRTRLNIEKLHIYESVHPFIEYMDSIEFCEDGETIFCVYGSRYKKGAQS